MTENWKNRRTSLPPGIIERIDNIVKISDGPVIGIQPENFIQGKLDIGSDADDEPKETVTFEKLLEDLGCFGKFQVFTLFAYLTLEIGVAFVSFIPIFVAGSGDNGNCTDTANENVTEAINGTLRFSFSSIIDDIRRVYNSPFKFNTLDDEWDLKCDRAWIPAAFTSCLMGGMIVGNLVASSMSDWYGRRKSYLGVVLTTFLGTLLSGLSPNTYFYAFARFLSGAGLCGFLTISCTAVMEFMTPQWRSLANCVGPIGEGVILLSVLAYFVRPWRMLYLWTLVPYILIIPLYKVLPESPRWLLRNNRLREAHSVLGYMAKMNGRKPVTIEALETLRRQEQKATEMQSSKKVGYMEFIRNRQLFVMSLYLFGIWFAWNVAYYGISYNIRNVPGNIYIYVGLIGLANALGQKSSMPACDRLGRRKAVLFGFTTCAIPLVVLAICFLTMSEVNPTVIVVACTIGLFGLACTRASTRLLSGESFPTSVRVMGLGIGSLGANLSGLITPQAAYIGSIWPSVPFFIFVGFAVFGSVIVFMMKETKGNPLMDNIKKSDHKKENDISTEL